MKIKASPTVDIHAHYYPARYLDAYGDNRDLVLPAWGNAPLEVLGLSERVSLMEATGVSCAVLSLGLLQPYVGNAEVGRNLAQLGNDELIRISLDWPGRLYTFAVLPLPHVDAALEEVQRVATVPSVVGFVLGCSIGAMDLDDPSLYPIFAELDRRCAVVALHPVMRRKDAFLATYGLARSVGGVLEDTEAALRIVLGGVVERFPSVRFVVPHLGGTLPFLLGRLQGLSAQALGQLGGLYYDTATSHRPALRCATDTFGWERLLFGTDFPYLDLASYQARTADIVRLGLPEVERRAILGSSAAELLSLSSRGTSSQQW